MTQMVTEPANFDCIALAYRWMEFLSFGRSLERCRNHFLPRLSECQSALLLGDGDGRFFARLLAENSEICGDAVDTSAAMLRLLLVRADSTVEDATGRLCIHHASALSFVPERTYDLIVTHFFLDCLTQSEVDGLALGLAGHVRCKGLWLISDFAIPSGAMHWPARCIVRLLYSSFRLLTGLQTAELPDHSGALTAAGFSRVAQHSSLAGLLSSEIWEYTSAMLPPQKPKVASIPDPVPGPEPASPSLPEPDPGVFHRERATPLPNNTQCSMRSAD